MLDIEVSRLHYAKTLQAWAGRFKPNRDKAQAMYDERFCRMCKLHLRGARYVFLSEHHVV